MQSVPTGAGGIIDIRPVDREGSRTTSRTAPTRRHQLLLRYRPIDAASIVADFEDAAGGPSNNHPVHRVDGRRRTNVWHHVAVSYDGQIWRLYLDGPPDGASSISARRPRRFHSTSRGDRLVGSALRRSRRPASSKGRRRRFASGTSPVAGPDRSRPMEQEIPSAAGLLGRYAMNEGTARPSATRPARRKTGPRRAGPPGSRATPSRRRPERPAGGRLRGDQPGRSPHTDDSLSVTVTSHDPNSDQVTYCYQWSLNDDDIAGATGATLNMATGVNGGQG